MTTENAISFRNIPRTTRLFQDFLYDFDNVARFYEPTGHDGNGLAARAARVVGQPFPRREIADLLAIQNHQAGASEATVRNIERLRQEDSVVVITGQQTGLFTGPLFTLYKALTVIKLTERLRAEGVNAVPMFWIASEDHDFAEVNHCKVVNREGQLTKITYTACAPNEGKPVGHVTLCDEISDNITQLLSALPQSEFLPRLETDLRETYKAGAGFAEAFGKLILRFLGKYGIVMIDPLDDGVKKIAGTIYQRAMAQAPEFAAALVGASKTLEAAGYHAQVFTSPEAVPLFMVEEGRRTALQRSEDGLFHLKGTERKFPTAEMVETVEQCPSCFSPNVTLRPIVQDFLLPTIAYVGGPAEVAYFAQLRPAYTLLDRIEPVILPRASLTIIEKRHAKTMQKYGLQFFDLFGGQQETMAKAVGHSVDASTAAVFERTERVIQEQIEELRASLAKVDPTLAEALKAGREKILYQLHGLHSRFIHNRSQRDETTRQQIERLFPVLYPNRTLQEREINASYFLARYGYDLIDRIYAEIEPGFKDHKLVYV